MMSFITLIERTLTHCIYHLLHILSDSSCSVEYIIAAIMLPLSYSTMERCMYHTGNGGFQYQMLLLRLLITLHVARWSHSPRIESIRRHHRLLTVHCLWIRSLVHVLSRSRSLSGISPCHRGLWRSVRHAYVTIITQCEICKQLRDRQLSSL